jgi:hypothetical protein
VLRRPVESAVESRPNHSFLVNVCFGADSRHFSV